MTIFFGNQIVLNSMWQRSKRQKYVVFERNVFPEVLVCGLYVISRCLEPSSIQMQACQNFVCTIWLLEFFNIFKYIQPERAKRRNFQICYMFSPCFSFLTWYVTSVIKIGIGKGMKFHFYRLTRITWIWIPIFF